MIRPYIRDTIGVQTSPLTISVEGWGNDVFLYWVSDCKGHEGEEHNFTFVSGTNIHEQSRSDFCQLLFKSTSYSKLYAISQHTRVPGITLYNSDTRKEIETAAWVNTTAEAQMFLARHPEHQELYRQWQQWAKFVRAQMRKGRLEDNDEKSNELDPSSDRGYYGNKHYDADYPEYSQSGQPGTQPITDDDMSKLMDGDSNLLLGEISSLMNKLKDQLNNEKQTGQNDYYKPASSNNEKQTGQNDYYKPASSNNARYGGYDVNNRYGLQHPPISNRPSVPTKRQRSPRKARSLPKKPRKDRKSSLDNVVEKYVYEHMRKKRHVGPHDAGIQRMISTGTLAPPLLDPTHPDYDHSMDFIFATYWFFPAKTEVILPEDEQCIQQRMQQEFVRFSPTSEYYGMDHDAYGHAVQEECLEKSGHILPDHGVYESQSTFNPYNIHMGQMTVYRVRIKCTCKGDVRARLPGRRCSKVLPYDQQQWPAYMGAQADSYSVPRKT